MHLSLVGYLENFQKTWPSDLYPRISKGLVFCFIFLRCVWEFGCGMGIQRRQGRLWKKIGSPT